MRLPGRWPGLEPEFSRGGPLSDLLYIMYIIGAGRRGGCILSWVSCPVTAIMSFDSDLVVSHVVVTAIVSFSSRRPWLGDFCEIKILHLP
jgi:hypothetical protein